MQKTQLVRVTRTIRQTYYVRVEGATSKQDAIVAAVDRVDEWGDRNSPGLNVSPWTASSRIETTVEEPFGLHATIDLSGKTVRG